MTREQIEKKLEELDKAETQIMFSSDYLSSDDKARMNVISKTRKELMECLEKRRVIEIEKGF